MPQRAIAGIERGLGVHRLMRALERADAEMHDAGRDARRGRSAGRAMSAGKLPSVARVQPLRHLPSSRLGSQSDSAGM